MVFFVRRSARSLCCFNMRQGPRKAFELSDLRNAATFKNSASVPVMSRVRVDARPYGREHAYRVRQLINHPIYGIGELVALIEPQKMDVLLADRVRRLIHSKR
jgi:hypothetical protein